MKDTVKARRKAKSKKLKILNAEIKVIKKALAAKEHELRFCRNPKGRVSGKSKGGAYENKIAKIIATAFSKRGFTQDDCYRTKNSGGGKQKGDIQFSSRLGKLMPYTIECKHYKGGKLLYELFFDSDKMQKSWAWISWWRQLQDEVKQSGKYGLLIWRENLGDDMVSFHLSEMEGTDLKESLRLKPHHRTRVNNRPVITCRLVDFLECALENHAREGIRGID